MSTGKEKEEEAPDVALRARLAFNVRTCRVRKGISQEELALRSGLHRTFVSDVEREIRNVALGNLGRLAQALGIDAMELLRPLEKADEELPQSLPKGPRRKRSEPTAP